MAFNIQKADYFNTSVKDQPSEAYKLLNMLAERGIKLLAFTAVPTCPMHAQLTIFPDDSAKMQKEAERVGMTLDGPHPAFMVQGDNDLEALADIHMKLFDENINIYASSGVSDGSGCFGYVIYIKPDEFKRSSETLGL